MRAAAAAAVAACFFAGCVEREIRVESDPPGAEVYVDGRHAGRTPLAEPFIFYGVRDVTVRLDGYVPSSQTVPVRAPWWQIIPLDFFFEHLWPGTLRDVNEVRFKLEPAREVEPGDLIERAKAWRANAETPPAK